MPSREFSTTLVRFFGTIGRRAEGAQQQGGLLSGKDPTEFNPSDPIRIWIVQVGIIIAMASLLSLGLKKIRQPKVIAEVLGGIILGPTALGRIPGFTEHIFPSESRSYLSLVANIGLCLFLFLVGLEIDGGIIKRNARLSATVGLFGMVIPFGFGAALAVPLYENFIKRGSPYGDPSLGTGGADVKFTHFMLFTGVAYSITAFPVLCRILTELKLLDTTVGIVVLSAGVANDIVGWVLLALSIALVNAASGLMAVWILLTCIGWVLFMLVPVRLALHWLARKTGSIEGGPSVFFMTATMLVVFASAFFTDIIGVHAIFGAFIAGLIVPRQGNLTIALTEKLEDIVSILFLPLYFTLSGLSTDLGLLDNGITWAYTIAIICLAFIGKFGGCTIAARYFAPFNIREASAIGSLMSCKGLVELIVLNVGLSAGILSRRVFSMFVLEALILTFATTPLVTALYPPHLRVRVAVKGANFLNVADDEKASRREKGKHFHKQGPGHDTAVGIGRIRRRFAVVLDRLENLPAVMAVTQLIQPPPASGNEPPDQRELAQRHSSEGSSKSIRQKVQEPQDGHTPPFHSIQIFVLRLLEFTDRHSAVMRSNVASSLLQTDPILTVFRMFVALIGLSRPSVEQIPLNKRSTNSSDRPHGQIGSVVIPALEIVPQSEFAQTTEEWAERNEAEVAIVPWTLHPFNDGDHRNGAVSGTTTPLVDKPQQSTFMSNPFETLFGGSSFGARQPADPLGSANQSVFLRSVFSRVGRTKDVALFVDTNRLNHNHANTDEGFGLGLGLYGGMPMPTEQHIFLPFFGGPDDRMALEFVIQLCMNPNVKATVMRIAKTEGYTASGLGAISTAASPLNTIPGANPGEKGEAIVITNISAPSNFPDTIYNQHNTEIMIQSETADNILWNQCVNQSLVLGSEDRGKHGHWEDQLAGALSRMSFKEGTSPVPLRTALQEARSLLYNTSAEASGKKHASTSPDHTQKRVVIVAGRSRRLAVENHRAELKGIIREHTTVSVSGAATPNPSAAPTNSPGLTSTSALPIGQTMSLDLGTDVQKTVGDVAAAFVVAGVGDGVLVLQASQEGL